VLRSAVDGVWSSKPAAAAWALDHGAEPELVRRALQARHGGAQLDADDVGRFLQTTLGKIEQTPIDDAPQA
jgi:hypothetical protein